ncbi:F-box/kelch-repeat protein [Tripterygium wilfordii]|uniref:F-box/kelch-repeat protein n=1 Tax=Tripterygium wilfordii TaxID=458696 RepID=A0A7J7D7R0_TRIWF|nr:F-box/kelch-repeat protein At1g57790-like [Tripterygium wilfordii]KAF5742086.1 F-box/kelch-repeat protein [Tripterygium wilfordii]
MGRAIKRLKKNTKSSRSWCDLPIDILYTIANRLDYDDQCRFRAVCKSWRPICGDHCADKLPWIMFYSWHRNNNHDFYKISCELQTLSTNRKYSIPIGREGIKNASIHDSKCGWVLLSKGEDKFNGEISLFFHSPFTNKIRETPKLCITSYSTMAASFSIDPTNPNCVVFVLTTSGLEFRVSTWKACEKTWKTHVFYEFYDCGRDVIFVDGSFYWVFVRNYECVLGGFNVEDQEFIIFMDQFPFSSSHLIGSDKDLLVTNYDCNVHRWDVFKFDSGSSSLVRLESLGDRVLFMGETSVSIRASEKTNKLANTVHLISYANYQAYCYNGSRSCHQIYNGISTESWFKKIWIQPP